MESCMYQGGPTGLQGSVASRGVFGYYLSILDNTG